MKNTHYPITGNTAEEVALSSNNRLKRITEELEVDEKSMTIGSDGLQVRPASSSGLARTASGLAIGHVPYALISDSTTQLIAVAANAQAITFNTNEELYDITHSTTSGTSRVVVNTAGKYLIFISAITSIASGAVPQNARIWFAVNGTYIPRSNTIVTMTSTSQKYTLAVSFIYTFNARDYLECYMSGAATTVQIEAQAEGTLPTRPACPSIILTMNFISV